LSNANSPSENAKIDPDVALMLRVKDDDAMAFELLIDGFQKKIIRFMNGWTRSSEQAEDLAQEVFLRVYKSRKNYLPTAKFSTWLYRIAHNVASNHIRDNSSRREYQLSKSENTSTSGLVLENIAVAPSGYQPVRKLDHEERSKVILLALDVKNLLDPYLQQGFVPGSPEAIQMEQARMSQFQDAPNENQREEDS